MFRFEIQRFGITLKPNKQGKFMINGLGFTALQLIRKPVYGVEVLKIPNVYTCVTTVRLKPNHKPDKKQSKGKPLPLITELIGSGYDFDLMNRDHPCPIGKKY